MPNIVAHALSGSSAHLPPPCAASGPSLSPAGSSLAVAAIASSPSASRVRMFQRYCALSSTCRRLSASVAREVD
jgi:hypothetical protein